ncbi:MAG: hypothetical protein LBI72_02085 [Flavobacteriaceae bacterium]|nr:hypothetical protein [Flavobacteriaceae bacterium]
MKQNLAHGSIDYGMAIIQVQKYNETHKYYYTNSSSYTDENGNEGMNIDIISKSQEGDAGRFVFEIEAKASLGVQIGVATPYGNLEGGIVTGDIGSLGYSKHDSDAPIAKWRDGKGHNFIGGGIAFKGLGLSGKVDYVTKDITPYGQLLDYYPNKGEYQSELAFGPTKSKKLATMPKFNDKVSLGGGDIGVKGGIPVGSNNHVIDINGGVKAILGIEGSIKIGITGRKRK